jgi:hypothetical protein
VCLEAFTPQWPARPLVIPCGHSVCENSLSSLSQELCPLDRLPFDRHQASVNHSLVDALAFLLASESSTAAATARASPMQAPRGDLQQAADAVADGCV